MFIIGLFPEKWIPCITVLFILAFIFYMHRSWVFTIIVAVLLGIYYLVNKTVKNERISKWIHIILFIGFLLVCTLLYLNLPIRKRILSEVISHYINDTKCLHLIFEM